MKQGISYSLLGVLMFLTVSNPAHKDNISHSNQKEAHMTGTEKNKQTVRKLYEEGFNKGNLQVVTEIIAAEWAAPTGEKGPSGFQQVVQGLRTGFPDIHYTIEDILADGDRVVVRSVWTGTHTGQFRAFAPTQKHVTDNAIAIFQLKDNKIIASWLQTDRLGFLQQIGVIPHDVAAPPKK